MPRHRPLVATEGRTDNLQEAVKELEDKGLVEPENKDLLVEPEEPEESKDQPKEEPKEEPKEAPKEELKEEPKEVPKKVPQKIPKKALTDEELAAKVTSGIYKMYSMDMLPACCVFPGGPGGMLPACIAAECYFRVPVVGICCKPIFYCCMKPCFICHCRACAPWMVLCPPLCYPVCKGKMPSLKTATCQLGTGKNALCALTCVKAFPCIVCCAETGLIPIDKVIEGYEPVPTEPWKTSFGLPAAPSNLVIGREKEFKQQLKDAGQEAQKASCSVSCKKLMAGKCAGGFSFCDLVAKMKVDPLEFEIDKRKHSMLKTAKEDAEAMEALKEQAGEMAFAGAKMAAKQGISAATGIPTPMLTAVEKSLTSQSLTPVGAAASPARVLPASAAGVFDNEVPM